MAEYPTSAGNVLSGLVRNQMLQFFGSFSPQEFIDSLPIVNCFVNTDIPDLSLRTPLVLTNYALCQGITEYITGYAMTSGTTTGGAIGVAPNTNFATVTEEDEFEMYGNVTFNNPALFLLYSFPMIFDVGKKVEDYRDAFEKFMKRLSLWLTFPFVRVDMSGFYNKIYAHTLEVDGKKAGFAFFNGKTEDGEDVIPIILDKLDEALSELQASNPSTDDAFKKYWDIMASGIVEYVNCNKIISIDTGVGIISDSINSVPALGPYLGVTTGKISFGSQTIVPICFGFDIPIIPLIPGADPLVSINLTFPIEIPDIKWPSITVRDANCFEREIVFSLSFDGCVPIAGETNIMQILPELIQARICAMVRQLSLLCFSPEEILEKMREIADAIPMLIQQMFDVMLSIFDEKVIQPLIKQIKLVLMQMTLDLSWLTIKNFLPAITLGFHADMVLSALGDKIDKLNAIIEKIKAFQLDLDFLAEFPNKITEMLNTINDYKELLNCDELEALIPDVNVPLPPLPVLPDLPFEPIPKPPTTEVIQKAIDDALATITDPPFLPPPFAEWSAEEIAELLEDANPIGALIEGALAPITELLTLPLPDINIIEMIEEAINTCAIDTSASPCSASGRPECEEEE